jgi:hypothetical protein
MISFSTSVVPPTIDWTRLSPQSSRSVENSGLVFPPVKAGSIGSALAAAFARCDLGGDHPPGDRLTAPQLPEPRRGLDNDAEPAAADIPAVDTDVDSGELITAQLPQVLVMHDASDSSQVGPCSREPPRGNQDLSRGQDAHHHSMGTYGARWPPRRAAERFRGIATGSATSLAGDGATASERGGCRISRLQRRP